VTVAHPRRDISVGKPDEKDVAVDRRESQGDVAEESFACWFWYRELINSVRTALTYGPIIERSALCQMKK
jgi:hypothetical protein